jgi:integrase
MVARRALRALRRPPCCCFSCSSASLWLPLVPRGFLFVRLRARVENERRDIINRPKMLKNENIEKILLHLDGQDKLIFRLSLESGLRISDVLNLRAWYLDKIIYVQEQKTGKHRIIELSDELWERLKPIKERATRTSDKKLYAFKSPRNDYKPVHRSTYHRHLKSVCKLLKIDFSAHSTRKLYAYNNLQSTKDIFEVQKNLNHKYVADTCRYLDLDYEKMIKDATNAILLKKN